MRASGQLDHRAIRGEGAVTLAAPTPRSCGREAVQGGGERGLQRETQLSVSGSVPALVAFPCSRVCFCLWFRCESLGQLVLWCA